MHRFGQKVYIVILEHLTIVLTTGNRIIEATVDGRL